MRSGTHLLLLVAHLLICSFLSGGRERVLLGILLDANPARVLLLLLLSDTRFMGRVLSGRKLLLLIRQVRIGMNRLDS